jgi:predicted RNA methylase
MRISNDVANVLGNSRGDDNKLYLPPEQLERSLYVAVNKVLEAIGGKWNRKEKAHLFSKPVADILEEILLTGEYTDAKKEYQFFETPDSLAQDLVSLADIRPGETCLEPSAGRGAIARHLPCPDCIELMPDNREYLMQNAFHVVADDFLQFHQPYDVIVGNPPFTRSQDIEHVTHMIELSRRRVVSVMSAGVTFRTNRKTLEFWELLDLQNGEIIDLPEKTFASSGTNVNAVVVVCDGAAA